VWPAARMSFSGEVGGSARIDGGRGCPLGDDRRWSASPKKGTQIDAFRGGIVIILGGHTVGVGLFPQDPAALRGGILAVVGVVLIVLGAPDTPSAAEGTISDAARRGRSPSVRAGKPLVVGVPGPLPFVRSAGRGR
jgi:hypothetical protein